MPKGYRGKVIELLVSSRKMLKVDTRRTKLGADHPSTLISMANLAVTYRDQGRDKKAFKLMKECVTLLTRIIGTSHPDTLSSRAILSRWQTRN